MADAFSHTPKQTAEDFGVKDETSFRWLHTEMTAARRRGINKAKLRAFNEAAEYSGI